MSSGGLFFVFKQKTADVVRISDWSSDVCSADLVSGDRVLRFFAIASEWPLEFAFGIVRAADKRAELAEPQRQRARAADLADARIAAVFARREDVRAQQEPTCAARGKSVSGPVGVGSRRINKHKKQ